MNNAVDVRSLGERICSTARGFEPLRAEPNGFLFHHLNHSVTLSMLLLMAEKAVALGLQAAEPAEQVCS